jgi:thioesterase domain-containing protein
MGVRVASAGVDRVELSAPLAPNINHRDTLFGGSAAAIATLAAWTLVQLRLAAADVDARLVISRSTMVYDSPVTGDFVAICDAPDEARWSRFLTTLDRRSRARVTVAARLEQEGATAARFEGDFVAIR